MTKIFAPVRNEVQGRSSFNAAVNLTQRTCDTRLFCNDVVHASVITANQDQQADQ